MGAGASASYELTAEQKAEITKTLEVKYQDLKEHNDGNETQLFNALKS